MRVCDECVCVVYVCVWCMRVCGVWVFVVYECLWWCMRVCVSVCACEIVCACVCVCCLLVDEIKPFYLFAGKLVRRQNDCRRNVIQSHRKLFIIG